MTERTRHPRLAAVPFILFLIFAVFWSVSGIAAGAPLTVLPSATVGLAIALRGAGKRRSSR